MTVALLLLGAALLVVGGELLVRGGVRCAEGFRLSPLLIGLTIVGLGASAPKLVTSVQAARLGSPDIAVGNIVGANMTNILLILGLAALIRPIAVESRTLARDGALMIGAALVFTAVAFTTDLSRPVGAVLAALLIGYVVYAYRQERKPDTDHSAALVRAQALGRLDPALQPGRGGRPGPLGVAGALVTALVGLAVVVVGSRMLVQAALDLSHLLGLSEQVVGLTIVAVGTSLPELVTSLVAAVRGQGDLAIGNLISSNIYNLLGVGGLTALLVPTAVPASLAQVDAPFMLGVSVLMVFFAWTAKSVSRAEGAVFLAFYVGYAGYLHAT